MDVMSRLGNNTKSLPLQGPSVQSQKPTLSYNTPCMAVYRDDDMLEKPIQRGEQSQAPPTQEGGACCRSMRKMRSLLWPSSSELVLLRSV